MEGSNYVNDGGSCGKSDSCDNGDDDHGDYYDSCHDGDVDDDCGGGDDCDDGSDDVHNYRDDDLLSQSLNYILVVSLHAVAQMTNT